jgi:hypothetical protein
MHAILAGKGKVGVCGLRLNLVTHWIIYLYACGSHHDRRNSGVSGGDPQDTDGCGARIALGLPRLQSDGRRLDSRHRRCAEAALGFERARQERRLKGDFFLDAEMPLFVLTAYAKNDSSDLTQQDRNDFKQLTAALVSRYKGRAI